MKPGAVNTFRTYSYKDCTSGSSKLTTQESLRFTRALCRIWAFINHWHHEQTPRPDPPFRYEFNLMTYGETILKVDEVRELREVWLFLSEVVGWMNASSGFADMSEQIRCIRDASLVSD
jgi:hypothetical protein